jgi:organic radical activating enzyme
MSTSLYDWKKQPEGLITIAENQVLPPEQKIILMARKPKVGVIGSTGTYCTNVFTSYSPLRDFPREDRESQQDYANSPRMTVREIVDIVKNKAPKDVYIHGGEPFFKFDDELCHLIKHLKIVDKTVTAETSGIIFPESFVELLSLETIDDLLEEDASETIDKVMPFMPDYFIIRPQIFDPVSDDETGGYFQHLPRILRLWRSICETWVTDYCWQFDIDLVDAEEQISHVVKFMKNLYEDSPDFGGTSIIFTPMPGNVSEQDPIFQLQALQAWVGKYIANFQNAHIAVQFNHRDIYVI